MKVLHIITGLETGGAEMMLVKLLTAHHKATIPSHVINLKRPGALQARIEAMGIPVDCLHLSIVNFPYKFFELAFRILRIQPTVIHTWMYHANLIGLVAKWLSGKNFPLVWGIRYALHNVRHNRWSTRGLIHLGAWLSSFPSAIVYNSTVGQTHHEKIGYRHPQSAIIPNGIDPNTWKPSTEARSRLRKELGLPQETQLIGLIGRFDPEKDPLNFIKATEILINENANVHFVLVGPGYTQENEQLKQWLQKSAAQDKTHLMGERDDIPTLTAGLDISTSASKTEAFPNIIVEAMACAVPCVVTDVGDSSRVLDDAGHVIPSEDPASMALAWNDLLGDRPRRKEMGAKGRRRVEENYAIDDVARQYENLYKSVQV